MEKDSKSQAKDQNPDDKAASKKEIEDGKTMAILAYILAPIPYFAEKKNKFVRYHAVQGMNILIVGVAYAIVANIINRIVWNAFVGDCIRSIYTGHGGCGGWGMARTISWILGVGGVVIGVIVVIGIVNAVNGKKKEVPILGKVKIIKK
ncbi:hypothetical protein FWG95_00145 [Candidatus Saccharibacteria bacterium]|nr:hypothetical protein [Candidatus Saccharibacteria bacterium]